MWTKGEMDVLVLVQHALSDKPYGYRHGYAYSQNYRLRRGAETDRVIDALADEVEVHIVRKASDEVVFFYWGTEDLG